MYKTYHWIGGSTGSTLASRFDWNVASNWKIVTFNHWDPSEPLIETASESPSGFDTVIIGGYYNLPGGGETLIGLNATSPLLFGGFSGDASNGGWSDSTYGATGTTYTSTLLEMIIKGNKSKEYFNDLDYNINYPFKIIGGGFTSGTISVFKKLQIVQGMTNTNWDYLFNNANSRQKQGLKIKTAALSIEVDASRGITTEYDGNTVSTWPITTELQLVDNYGSASGNEDITTVVDINSVNVGLKLLNSKISYINFEQPFIWWPAGSINAEAYKNARNEDRSSLILQNCIVEKINCLTYLKTDIDINCLIGQFILKLKPIESGGKGSIYWPRWNIESYFGGTYDTVLAATSLRKFPVLSGVSLANIDIDLTQASDVYRKTQPVTIRLGNFNNANLAAPRFEFNCDYIRINDNKPSPYMNQILPWNQVTNIRKMDIKSTRVSLPALTRFTVRNLIMRENTYFASIKGAFGRTNDIRIGEVSSNSIFGGFIMEDPPSFNSYNGRVDLEKSAIIQTDIVNNFVTYAIDGNSNNRINQYYINAEEFENAKSL